MSNEEEKRDPRAKFVELANARVARVVKDLRLVGNLSNKKNYDYSEEEAKKIVRVIEAELEILKAKFRAKPLEHKNLFQL